jgi:hypothetical protein
MDTIKSIVSRLAKGLPGFRDTWYPLGRIHDNSPFLVLEEINSLRTFTSLVFEWIS